jgi:hypothetical protein
MIWTENALNRLNELVKFKFDKLREAICLVPNDIGEQSLVVERAWHNYCMSVGIKMNIIPDHHTETREDLPSPGEAMLLADGTIRIRNIWGDKYIDMPEEFAFKALALDFLP